MKVGLSLIVGERAPLGGELLHGVAHGGCGAKGSFDIAQMIGLVEHECRFGTAYLRRHGGLDYG